MVALRCRRGFADCVTLIGTGGAGCAVTVVLKAPAKQETIRWYDIWAAAVAVDASEWCSHVVSANEDYIEA